MISDSLRGVILEPTARERQLAQVLRGLALPRLEGMSQEEAGSKLGLLPRGVRSLFWRDEWDLVTAFRVADALGIFEEIAHDMGQQSNPG